MEYQTWIRESVARLVCIFCISRAVIWRTLGRDKLIQIMQEFVFHVLREFDTCSRQKWAQSSLMQTRESRFVKKFQQLRHWQISVHRISDYSIFKPQHTKPSLLQSYCRLSGKLRQISLFLRRYAFMPWSKLPARWKQKNGKRKHKWLSMRSKVGKSFIPRTNISSINDQMTILIFKCELISIWSVM